MLTGIDQAGIVARLFFLPAGFVHQSDSSNSGTFYTGDGGRYADRQIRIADHSLSLANNGIRVGILP